MKKILVAIFCVFISTASVFAINRYQEGIKHYKSGNYIGSMEAMKQVVSSDPANLLARYYLAVSYVQLGFKDEAKNEYENIIKLNPNSQVANYAKKGLEYLGESPATPSTLPEPPKPSTETGTKVTPPVQNQISDQAKEKLINQKLQNVLDNVNKNKQVDPTILKDINDLTNKKSQNTESQGPTAEEIVQAIRILQQAGINQNVATNSYNPQAINPELIQMNMLMSSMNGMGGMNGMNGNNNNNNFMNMLPMLMMQGQNGGQKIDPQMMQTMIMGSMMPNMMLNSGNNDNGGF